MPDAPQVLEAPPTPPPAAAAPEAPVVPHGHEEAFGALDALAHDEPTPEPPPTDGRVRGPDGKFLPKPADKPKPHDKPPVEKPNGEDIDPTKLKTSELAKHYHKLKAEQKEWLKKQEEYETKLKAPKEWPEEKTYKEKLAEREKAIEEHKKRVAEYENELRFSNYEKSQEYKDTYEKPYVNAFVSGRNKAAALKIIEVKNEDGAIVQQGRAGTAEDFDALMKIQDDDVAADRAVELYGAAKAPLLLFHRERVKEMSEKASTAIKEYREKGAELEKQKSEYMTKAQKEGAEMVENFRLAAVEKYPTLFKPDESDPKGNELLERGNHLLQRVLRNGAPIKDGEQPMTREELAIAAAAVRNKAAAFDRVAYKASSLAKRVKELEADLAKYKASTPGNGDGKGREAAPEEETAEQKLYKLGKER